MTEEFVSERSITNINQASRIQNIKELFESTKRLTKAANIWGVSSLLQTQEIYSVFLIFTYSFPSEKWLFLMLGLKVHPKACSLGSEAFLTVRGDRAWICRQSRHLGFSGDGISNRRKPYRNELKILFTIFPGIAVVSCICKGTP